MSRAPANPIPRPWRVNVDAERDLTSLYFDKKNPYFPTDQSVDFYIRGAVCWPATIGAGVDQSSEGFFILGAQHLASKRIYIFEQRSFVCIDHITEPGTGRILYEGIAPWLMVWRARYYVDTYYWHDHTDTHSRYLLQLLRSPMLEPKPWFAEVVWYDDAQAQQILWEAITLQRLIHWAGESPEKGRSQPLYDALLLFRDQGTVLPAAKAAMTLVTGYERFPWRPRNES